MSSTVSITSWRADHIPNFGGMRSLSQAADFTTPRRGAGRRTSRLGFSLVEIVLAIGIVSFALLGMMGLVSVSFQSERSSASDTDLAALTQQVFSSLRSLPFTNLSDTNFFFDADGSLATSSAGAVYECAVTLAADPSLPASFKIPAASFKNARLQFTWPVSAVIRPNTNVFLGGIANYGN